MANSVKSRPSHYETLGLAPGASADDVAEAFATTSRKHIEDPRSTEPDMRERARQIRAAHETLRDPAKRNAYDRSLGLTSEPKPEQSRAAEPSAVPFVAAPSPDAMQGPAPDEGSNDPRPEVWPSRAPVAPVAASFIAPALRHPVERRAYYTSATRSPEAVAQQEPEPELQAEPEPLIRHDPDPVVPEEEFPRVYVDTAIPDVEEPRARSKRGFVAVLIALLAVAALSAWLMWPFGRNADRLQTTSSARIAPSTAAPPMPSSAMPQLPQQMPVTEDEAAALAQESVGSISGSMAPISAVPVPTRIAPVKPGAPDPLQPIDAPAPASAPDATAAPTPPEAPPVTGRQSPPSAPTQAVPVGASNVAPAPAPVPTPALGPNRQAPARLISGGLTGRDNPRGQFEGTVSVRFVVGRSGEVTGCEATASSGNPALDARTCGLVAQKLRFSPALNPQGRPIASEMRATYTWGRNHRSLTGRLLDLVRKRPQ